MPTSPLVSRQSTRATAGKNPSKLQDYYLYNAKEMKREPTSYADAISRPDGNLWYKAMLEELSSITKNDTWELTDLPEGRKAIGSKWVYKLKSDKDENIEQYKARLVAQGFSQKFGIDYDEIFA